MTISEQETARLDRFSKAIYAELYAAYIHYYLLLGFNKGAKEHPEVLEKHAEVVTELWRALFWSLFLSLGKVIDTSKDTYSLPNVLRLLQKYFGEGSELGKLAKEIDDRLKDEDAPFKKKIKKWRNKVLAHNTTQGQNPKFFEEHQMDLDEFGPLIDELVEMFDSAIWNSIGISYSDLKDITAEYEKHGQRFFQAIAS